MPNCRSIPPEVWAQARDALVRYFASRHGHAQAEDMAHETLFNIWEREDYEFEDTSHFPKVCLGFARKISLQGFRRSRNAHEAFEFDAAAPAHKAESHRATESRILLDEVCKIGATELKDRQWRVIRDGIFRDECKPNPPESPREANRERVYLHRARQRLRQITGWGKK